MSNNAYHAKTDYFTVTFKPSAVIAGGMAGLMGTILEFFISEQGIEMQTVPMSVAYLNYQTAFRLVRPVFGGETAQAGVLAFSEYSEVDTRFNQGLILSLSGVGCHGVDFAYFLALFAPLKPRITRVDLAIDYFDGEVNETDIDRWFKEGCFRGKRGAHPTMGEISRRDINGSKSGGTTVYVGERGATRMTRGYDKTAEIASFLKGDDSLPFPNWFRVEFEYRPAGRAVIPLECLADVDSFLASTYPRLIPDVLPLPNHSLRVFNQSQYLPLRYENPQFDVSLYHLIAHAKRCYGPLVNVLRNHLNQSSDEIVEALLESDKIPRRLHLPT